MQQEVENMDWEVQEIPEHDARSKVEYEFKSKLVDAQELDKIIQTFVDFNIEQIEKEKHPDIQSEKQNFSDIHACKICFNTYNSSNKCPKMLHCGHTYCIECLIKIRAQKPTLICPLCKFEENQQVFQALPTNYLALDAVEIHQEKIEKIKQRLLNNISLTCNMHNQKKISSYGESTREVYCNYCDDRNREQNTISLNQLFERLNLRKREICQDMIQGTVKMQSNILEMLQDQQKQADDLKEKLRKTSKQLVSYIEFVTTNAISDIDDRYSSFVKQVNKDATSYDIDEIKFLKDHFILDINQYAIVSESNFNNLKEFLRMKEKFVSSLKIEQSPAFKKSIKKRFKQTFANCDRLYLEKECVEKFACLR